MPNCGVWKNSRPSSRPCWARQGNSRIGVLSIYIRSKCGIMMVAGFLYELSIAIYLVYYSRLLRWEIICSIRYSGAGLKPHITYNRTLEKWIIERNFVFIRVSQSADYCHNSHLHIHHYIPQKRDRSTCDGWFIEIRNCHTFQRSANNYFNPVPPSMDFVFELFWIGWPTGMEQNIVC